MKKNTKKKVLTLTLVILLLSIAIVGGSLAWFTAEDEATNVFTVGTIEIEQIEDFDETTAVLMPVVGADPSVEGDNYIRKVVTVKNTGKNPAYIQTLVAVPAVLDNNGILKLYDKDYEANGWEKLDGDSVTTGIQPMYTNITIPGETHPYNVYVYRYTSALGSNVVTNPCLQYVYIASETDMNTYAINQEGVTDTGYFVVNGTEIKDFDALDGINVYVRTQAVQSQGFGSADEALNSVFSGNPSFNN